MMTQENTEDYSDQELNELNEEFLQRFHTGEWIPADINLAEKWFNDEVARR